MNRQINYSSKDFSSIKKSLIEYAKNYFPDTVADFTEASPGMMFLEMVAYVGDIMSYYQDAGIQETFLQYARNPESLYSLAYMMGYRPKVTGVSQVELTFTQTVADDGTGKPNYVTATTVPANTVVRSTEGSAPTFVTKNTLYFREDTCEKEQSGNDWMLKGKVKAYSGTVKTKTFNVGGFEKYRTLTLTDSNIVNVLSIVDSNGQVWTEVPFLGQNTVFKENQNDNSLLTLEEVPYRYVTRFTKNGTLQVQFGSGNGDIINLNRNISENSSDVLDTPLDPENYIIASNSYGIAPVNTTLTVTYLTGGGIPSNVSSDTITVIVSSGLNTLSVTNEEPATGGRNGDTLDEIRENSIRSFAEQKRIVTLSDFCTRAMMLPSQFGKVSKAYATHGHEISTVAGYENPLETSLYILSYDGNGKLAVSNSSLKENLRKYLSQYLMLTDTVSIKDAYIVNIVVNYSVVLKPNTDSIKVLKECTAALQEFFSTENRQINEAINLTDAYSVLNRIQGVQYTSNIAIENISSTVSDKTYSEYTYDMSEAIVDRVLYPSYDPCIFEVKYPEINIQGRVVTP